MVVHKAYEECFHVVSVMSSSKAPREYGSELFQFAVVFAIGLLMMGYSTITYWQYAYMRANPGLGDVSTSAGGLVFHLGLFLAGSIMTFTVFMTALYKVLRDTDS